MRGSWRLGALLFAVAATTSAVAQDLPDYRDDRSTAQSVVESLYNAIERKEFARAFSYLRDEPERPTFASFADGYAETAHVRVRTGEGTSDAAAGSIYHAVPVVVEAVGTDGEATVYTGCYELRLVQPASQVEPPFQPMGIVRGALAEISTGFDETTGDCPQEGL